LTTQSLGTRLRAERESRGFTLSQIADSTKIPQTLLEALERDNLSRWPKGLYRRAFFRSYVTALGLSADPLVVEFARLFPDDTEAPAAPHGSPAGDVDASEVHPPLALSWAGPSTTYRMLRSFGLALLEVAIIAAVGSAIAWAAGWRLFEAIGAVALLYLPAARVAAERSARWQRAHRRAPARKQPERPAFADVSSNAMVLEPPSIDVGVSSLDGRLPAAVGVADVDHVVAPVARRTGQWLKAGAVVTGRRSMRSISATSALVIRASRTAGVRVARGVRDGRRFSSRAFSVASHAFWKAVRSAAEYAEVLARRRLNRAED
jgi:transcriptional regulator with XRE-family HTH domain